jgi:hypothetical protein
VQSALLEAMQEKQVTIGDQTFKLPEPFLVLATQNPIEQEGTYPLPEAQVDRFMLKLEDRLPVARRGAADSGSMAKRGTPDRHAARGHARANPQGAQGHQRHLRGRQGEGLHRGPRLRHARPGPLQDRGEGFIQLGASPRATIALTLAAKAYAFLKGRGYVTPQDVKSIGMDVLRHRVAITYEAEAEEKTSETSSRKSLMSAGASGQFGSVRQTKNELAAELAAVLAFSAIRNNDKVGLIMFTDRGREIRPAEEGPAARAARRARDSRVSAARAAGRTSPTLALDYLNRVQPRRAVTFVVSDFQVTDEESVRKKLRVASKRHDVIALSLRDPREEELPAVGLVELRDAETGERALVDTFDRKGPRRVCGEGAKVAAGGVAPIVAVGERGPGGNPFGCGLRAAVDPVFQHARATNLMEDIRDIKGLVPLPHGGGGCGCCWLIVPRRRSPFGYWKTASSRVFPRLSHRLRRRTNVAIRELRRLREENPPVEEFYTRLSDIVVRQYLEGQMGLRAPERTTEEFLYEVSRDHSPFRGTPEDLLGAFLQEADLVKFARFQPGAEDRKRALDAAEKFVAGVGWADTPGETAVTGRA